jgi:hypothetical protein
MSLPIYSTGTVSVAAGGTVVTGTGAMWSGTNAKQGDFISINNLATVLITEVTDATHLKIAPWPGATQTNVAYTIYQNYVGRVVGVAAAEDVGVMLEKLHVDGLPFIVGPDETAPDPSYGDEGQLAFQPSTGKWWEKTGGAWVPSIGITASDPTKVAKVGDTMTGELQINIPAGLALFVRGKENVPSLAPTDPYAIFQSANGGFGALSIGGRPAPPYSAWIQSSNSGGTALPLEINTAGGNVGIGKSPATTLDVAGAITSALTATTGTCFFGNSGAKSLNYDGTNFNLVGGDLIATAPTQAPGDNTTKLATTAFVKANASAALPPRYWQGYQHANNVTSPNTKVDVAAGSARNSTNIQDIANAAGTIDCAVVGANGLDAGALAASKWYYTFAIATAAGATAFLASLSSTAPTLPASYTVFRRIGAVRTNASAQIIAFKHLNDRWYWVNPPRDVNVASVVLGTNVTVALPSAPAILGVLARISVVAFPNVAAAGTVYIAPSYVLLNVANGGGMMSYNTTNGATLKTEVEVDGASQINYLIYSASGTHTLVIDVVGWIDPL